MVASFIKHFSELEDSRIERKKLHALSDILVLVICAMISGANAVAERLENFERYYESIAHPFEWKFTRADLNALIARMRSRYAEAQHLKLAA